MNWMRWGAEHTAFSYVRGVGSKARFAEDRLVVGWRAFRSGPGEWTLALFFEPGGTLVEIARAGTLHELKSMADSAARKLGHELDP